MTALPTDPLEQDEAAREQREYRQNALAFLERLAIDPDLADWLEHFVVDTVTDLFPRASVSSPRSEEWKPLAELKYDGRKIIVLDKHGVNARDVYCNPEWEPEAKRRYCAWVEYPSISLLRGRT